MTSKTGKDTEDTGGKMWVNPQAKKKKKKGFAIIHLHGPKVTSEIKLLVRFEP